MHSWFAECVVYNMWAGWCLLTADPEPPPPLPKKTFFFMDLNKVAYSAQTCGTTLPRKVLDCSRDIYGPPESTLGPRLLPWLRLFAALCQSLFIRAFYPCWPNAGDCDTNGLVLVQGTVLKKIYFKDFVFRVIFYKSQSTSSLLACKS